MGVKLEAWRTSYEQQRSCEQLRRSEQLSWSEQMGKLRTDWYCQQWRNDTARRTIARVGGRGKDDVIRGYCVRCPPSCVLCTLHDPDAPRPPPQYVCLYTRNSFLLCLCVSVWSLSPQVVVVFNFYFGYHHCNTVDGLDPLNSSRWIQFWIWVGQNWKLLWNT